jgi:tetratricopeptide (TPR) repeat protein
MKTKLILIALFVSMFCSFSNGGEAKVLPVLDKAWSARSFPRAKKFAFLEYLQKEMESHTHTPENLSRLQLAQALVLLSEEKSRLSAAELISRAAETHRLNVTPHAVSLIWKDFVSKLDDRDASQTNALIAVAGALATAGHKIKEDSLAFYTGLYLKNSEKPEKAITLFSAVQPSSRFYRPAKLNEGLFYASSGKLSNAQDALELVLTLEKTPAEKSSGVGKDTVINQKEYAAINLARLMFETKRFKEAVTLYRTIDSKSPLFYDSLSEQGWAFFLAGHPNRALGAEYGASSPFFGQQFQPDLYFLRASVNYWLCDFKTALRNIQAYVVHTKDDASILRKWSIDKANSHEEYRGIVKKAFKVTEDLAHGVTASNSLLGPRGLRTIARNRNLLQKVKSLDELRARRKSIQESSWPAKTKNLVINSLMRWEEKEQEQIGRQSLALIGNMRLDYERTLLQIRMLHMEIMTAEKDLLMSKERSAEGQQFTGTEKDFFVAAEREAQVWTNEKREFWQDELDSFVFTKKSQCNNKEGEEISHAGK